MHFLIFVLVAVGGIAVGAIGHAYFAKEAVATKAELQTLRDKLAGAFDADVQTARNTVNKVISDIEKKL